ncbi:MFS transporter [Roseobacter weihaiensis]|uniref:MFS transporter n=1 Tax=Roseobacter weihaiensis TaxID=2763262 RepID=UPI001D0B6A64|nr:MFS transporter [Roseobacter sp. H9]
MTKSLRQILSVFLLWLAGLGAAAQFAKIVVPFSYIKETYPHIGNELGWMLSFVSLVGAILGIAAGGLVAKVGTKRMLLFGMGLGAAVSLWQASFPSFPVMLFSRVIEGISHLAIVVAAPTLIAQISSDRYRGAAMALWSTFFGVSFALLAWLGLPLIESNGLSALFVLHGVFMFMIATVLLIDLRQVAAAGPVACGLSFRDMVENHLRAYQSPTISAPGIGWLFYTLTFVSLLAILPPLLPDAIRTGVTGLMPLASIASSLLLVPLLLRSLSSVRIVIIGFFGAILLVFLALLGAPLAVVSVALFCVLGLVQGASFSAVPELNKSVETQALAYGVMAQTGNIGNLLGTPLLLAFLSMAGNSAVFALVAALYAVGILAHLLTSRRRARQGV